jgi:hypothetical protein
MDPVWTSYGPLMDPLYGPRLGVVQGTIDMIVESEGAQYFELGNIVGGDNHTCDLSM